MRLAAQAKGGFYPTPPRVLDLLATLLRPPARLPARYHGAVRLLDPCCGAGAALAQLATRLRHCTRYLAEHGLLVFIVPRRRLPVSARFLAAHYRRLQCWAFPHPERTAFDQVVLTGCRRAQPQPDPAAEQQLHQWAEGELRALTPAPTPRYTVPATPAGDLLFSTRTVDPLAAATEARRSGLWTQAAITDALWPPQTPRPRPLRRGHLAMLVAAGFLDNLCLEANGQRLLVKGRTAKELVLVTSTREQEIRRERLRTTVVALDLATGTITDIAA